SMSVVTNNSLLSETAVQTAPMASALNTLKMLVRYKAWADALTFSNVRSLPEGEALKQRPTRFGNMVHTLNHIYVVDDIFRHHLQGKKHG
ncbi:DinB family protein, partial [Aeromonas veronii]|uniref:DinB family protein n=1 Tax=Aeromonas veronii TaxID=654 RepID=UPI0023507702